MTTNAAANLLIGANVWCEPKATPLAVERHRTLQSNWRSRDCEIECLNSVRDARTFGDALENLIEAMPDVLNFVVDAINQGGYTDRVANLYKKALLTVPWDSPPITLGCKISRFSAEIDVRIWTGASVANADWRILFHERYDLDFDLREKGFYGDLSGDRDWSSVVTGRTLLELWRVLQGDEEDGAVLELRMA